MWSKELYNISTELIRSQRKEKKTNLIQYMKNTERRNRSQNIHIDTNMNKNIRRVFPQLEKFLIRTIWVCEIVWTYRLRYTSHMNSISSYTNLIHFSEWNSTQIFSLLFSGLPLHGYRIETTNNKTKEIWTKTTIHF